MTMPPGDREPAATSPSGSSLRLNMTHVAERQLKAGDTKPAVSDQSVSIRHEQ